MKHFFILPLFLFACSGCLVDVLFAADRNLPNIILIYADDLGYGDLSCYGGKDIPTPNLDAIASVGIRFTNAHTTSSTCTPSRFGLLTGRYPWRQRGTGVAPGDAGSIIPPACPTMASVLQQAGYVTGVVGKWHLGLGGPEGPNWNGKITPGPLEYGFNYSFLIPATGDRVPCVYVENHHVWKLNPNDPITVNYAEKVGDWPTGKERPDLLTMSSSHGHNNTIVNGIGRIGYMTGGKEALWVDEDMADTITDKAIDFVQKNKTKPFFLYFSTHDIHVPRVPHPRYAGKSGHGNRGDVILQFDESIGRILRELDRLQLRDNTLLLVTSDNGPIVDDGYHDQSIELLGEHKPAGPFRGAKYSAFEAGTRVPLLVSWPARIRPTVSNALVSQIDFFASLAALASEQVPEGAAQDSRNALPTLLGEDQNDREFVIEQASPVLLTYVTGRWKYIEPTQIGSPTLKQQLMGKDIPVETGRSPEIQLYDLSVDPGEKENVAAKHPDIVSQLQQALKKVRN